MRAPRWMWMGVGAALLAAAGCGAASRRPAPAADPAPQAAADCAPVGEIRFICDLNSPEDLAVLPGEDWVIASGNQEGGMIHLVNVGDRTSSVLYPADAPRERARRRDVSRLSRSDRSRRGRRVPRPRPVSGAWRGRGPHRLSRAPRLPESVEVFEVDGNANPPELTWVGCAVAPEPLTLNSVVALPDGGFAATSFRTAGLTESLADIQTGAISGSVWEWRTDGGWTEVPGSETGGPNGLEISDDGEWFYIAGWGSSASSACRGAAIPSSVRPWTCTSGPTICACSPTGRSSRPGPTASTRRTRRSTWAGSTADAGGRAGDRSPRHRAVRGLHDSHPDRRRDLDGDQPRREDRLLPRAVALRGVAAPARSPASPRA